MELSVNLNRSTIIKNISTLFTGSVVSQAMTALALLLTARQLGAENYGKYAACIAITSISSIFFSLGLDNWLLREGGRTRSKLPLLAGSVIGIKTIFGIVWMVLFSIAARILDQETYPITLIHWSVLIIWLDILLATTLTSFKSALANKIPALLEASADFFWFGLTLLTVYLGYHIPELFMQIRALVSCIALIIALLLLFRFIGIKFDLPVTKVALGSVLPFAISEFLGSITLRADVVIIGLTIGEYPTGIYSPAVGLVNMAFLVPLAVFNVMVPVLSNLYRNHPQQAPKTSKRVIILMLVIGILLSILFLIAAPLLTIFLGSSYLPSVQVLRILSLVLLFKCLSYAMAAIIIATDKQVRRTYIQVIAASINVLLNLLVVQVLGVKGVAGVYVITEMVLLAGYSFVVWSKK